MQLLLLNAKRVGFVALSRAAEAPVLASVSMTVKELSLASLSGGTQVSQVEVPDSKLGFSARFLVAADRVTLKQAKIMTRGVFMGSIKKGDSCWVKGALNKPKTTDSFNKTRWCG